MTKTPASPSGVALAEGRVAAREELSSTTVVDEPLSDEAPIGHKAHEWVKPTESLPSSGDDETRRPDPDAESRHALQSMWETLAVCRFCTGYRDKLGCRPFALKDLEDTFASPTNTALQIDIALSCIRVLNSNVPPSELNIDTWHAYLDVELKKRFPSSNSTSAAEHNDGHSDANEPEEEDSCSHEDELPLVVSDSAKPDLAPAYPKLPTAKDQPKWVSRALKHGFASLSVVEKLLLVQQLCAWVFESDDLRTYRATSSPLSLHTAPLGRDGAGNYYWFIEEAGARLYREARNETKRNPHGQTYIGPLELVCWEPDDWESFAKWCESGGSVVDRELGRILRGSIFPAIKSTLEDMRRQRHTLQIHKVKPRDRSSRLARKELERKEKQRLEEERARQRELKEAAKRKRLEKRRLERRRRLAQEAIDSGTSRFSGPKRRKLAGKEDIWLPSSLLQSTMATKVTLVFNVDERTVVRAVVTRQDLLDGDAAALGQPLSKRHVRTTVVPTASSYDRSSVSQTHQQQQEHQQQQHHHHHHHHQQQQQQQQHQQQQQQQHQHQHQHHQQLHQQQLLQHQQHQQQQQQLLQQQPYASAALMQQQYSGEMGGYMTPYGSTQFAAAGHMYGMPQQTGAQGDMLGGAQIYVPMSSMIPGENMGGGWQINPAGAVAATSSTDSPTHQAHADPYQQFTYGSLAYGLPQMQQLYQANSALNGQTDHGQK